jgi:kynurenine formamidase
MGGAWSGSPANCSRQTETWKRNIDWIGAARCRFIALPLAIEGADGSPVRAIAQVD